MSDGKFDNAPSNESSLRIGSESYARKCNYIMINESLWSQSSYAIKYYQFQTLIIEQDRDDTNGAMTSTV